MSAPPVKPRIASLAAPAPPDVPPGVVRLHLNESPFDFPQELKERVWDRIRGRGWNRYPGAVAGELRDAIASHLALPAGCVVVGNGSSELLLAALGAALDPGRALVVPRPSFELYDTLGALFTERIAGAELDEDLAYAPGPFLDAVARHAPAAVLLGSPNNPTGSRPGEELVRALLADGARLVIADEAYREFASAGCEPLLPHHGNLAILRTFSKAWSLAGLRIGYLLAAPALAAEIRKAVPPFSVNAFSEACALVALEEPERMRERAAAVVRLRDGLAAGLQGIPGIRVFPSEASFLLVRVARPAAVHAALAVRGVLVRDLSARPRLDGCLRITVGTEQENGRLLDALREATA